MISRVWTGLGCAALAVAVAAQAAPAAMSDPTRALRVRGVQIGFNLDHAEAIAAFREAIAADPHNPANRRMAAAAAWAALLFQQGAVTMDDYLGETRSNVLRASPDPVLAATVRDELKRAIALAEERLRQRPHDADAHFHVGAGYAFLASYAATIEGRVVGTLGPARRAYQAHTKVLELDPARKDAGLVVGLYRYGVSQLSLPARMLAKVAGFSGGRETAIRLVEEAAGYPSDAQPNAMFSLVLIYNREKRFDNALRIIGQLQQRYPRNRLLWLEAGTTSLRAGRPAEARAAIEAGLARLATDRRPRAFGEESRWKYAYGATLVALNDRAAEAELRAALRAATRDWVRGRVHRELGKLAQLAGDRSRALGEYREAYRLCHADNDTECTGELQLLRKAGYR